jgi:hypothetical protein
MWRHGEWNLKGLSQPQLRESVVLVGLQRDGNQQEHVRLGRFAVLDGAIRLAGFR